jgi:outer membrane protein insertion porin family
VDVRPQIKRDREGRKIDITFRVLDAPRVYVERVNITGNVRTLDRVIRREFRIQEGDAFNSALVKRSENRLNRLNFFREVEVEQLQGSQPDRMVIDVKVEEQATGELNLGAGFSSLENFIFDFSIRERNLMGKGQDLRLGLRMSGIRQEIDLGFTENYFGGRNVAAGFDLFARKIDSTQYGSIFNTTSYGFSLRAGMAINEYWQLSTRYTLRQDDVNILSSGIAQYYASFASARYTEGLTDQDEIDERVSRYDTNGDGVVDDDDFDLDGDGLDDDDRLVALPRSLSDSVGKRWQSIVGYTVGFDTRNSIIRPTRGHSFYFSQDFAGLGGNVRYLRSSITTDNYWTPWEGWTFRLGGEAGIINGLGQDVRLSDKFFIGGPRIRGFDTSGMGPRDFANNYAIGGTAYYIGRGELFFPLGDAALESGINASAFIDAGSLFRAQEDLLQPCAFTQAEYDAADADNDFSGLDLNCLSGNSPKPRISVGIGFSWQSPFGPFRIDLSKQLMKQLGDRTQTLQFNVGTTF